MRGVFERNNNFSVFSEVKFHLLWGRPYRNREEIVPWKGMPVSGWKAKVNLERGTKLFLSRA